MLVTISTAITKSNFNQALPTNLINQVMSLKCDESFIFPFGLFFKARGISEWNCFLEKIVK